MKTPGRRIAREKQTIEVMMGIYCRDHHGGARGLCGECGKLLDYALRRLDTCPFQEAKPACNHCEVHCYSAVKRERVKAVMRYAGPRMLLRHPVLSLFHLRDKWRPLPSLPDSMGDASAPRNRDAAPGSVGPNKAEREY
ncbi:MAG: nitrous oxide-stimulated promoter family protein [Pseudomonadota bacterium]|nr:nitrous oxide-stimulated promoter family protein [Pseudomonadota bacterium]